MEGEIELLLAATSKACSRSHSWGPAYTLSLCPFPWYSSTYSPYKLLLLYTAECFYLCIQTLMDTLFHLTQIKNLDISTDRSVREGTQSRWALPWTRITTWKHVQAMAQSRTYRQSPVTALGRGEKRAEFERAEMLFKICVQNIENITISSSLIFV